MVGEGEGLPEMSYILLVVSKHHILLGKARSYSNYLSSQIGGQQGSLLESVLQMLDAQSGDGALGLVKGTPDLCSQSGELGELLALFYRYLLAVLLKTVYCLLPTRRLYIYYTYASLAVTEQSR